MLPHAQIERAGKNREALANIDALVESLQGVILETCINGLISCPNLTVRRLSSALNLIRPTAIPFLQHQLLPFLVDN